MAENRLPIHAHQDLVRAVLRFLQQPDYGLASSFCRQILADDPNNFLALYLSGLLAYRAGDPQRAVALIDEARRLHPALDAFGFTTRVLEQKGSSALLIAHETLRRYCDMAFLDGFLLSFPKCGRTWVNMFLTRYLFKENESALTRLDNTIRVETSDGTRRFIFAHDDFPHQIPWTALYTDKSAYRGKRVCLIVRDPRDVVVSYYFQYTKLGSKEFAKGTFAGTLSDFIRYEIGGIRSIVGFYTIWANNRHIPAHFMTLRYEDLRANPGAEFKKLLDFFGIPDMGRERFDSALAYSSFENMQQLERSGTVKSRHLTPPADGDPEGFKVRRGIVGGYKDYLSAEDQQFVDAYITSHLDDYFACYKHA